MLQNLLKKQFGVVVRSERTDVNGYALLQDASGLKLKRGAGDGRMAALSFGYSAVHARNHSLIPLTTALSNLLKKPVFDETGATDRYDYAFAWGPPRSEPPGPGERVDSAVIIKALKEQFGLRLEPRRKSLDVMHVVSAKPAAQVVTPPRTQTPAILSQREVDLLAGRWNGTVNDNLRQFVAVLTFTANERGELTGTLSDPHGVENLSVPHSIQSLPLSDVRFSGSTLSFTVPGSRQEFVGVLANDSISGTWKWLGRPVQVRFNRGEPESPALALSAKSFDRLAGRWAGKEGILDVALVIERDSKNRVTGYYENLDTKDRVVLGEASLTGTRLAAKGTQQKVNIVADVSGSTIKGTYTMLGGPPTAFTLSRQ
jgi:hypothetical protein